MFPIVVHSHKNIALLKYSHTLKGLHKKTVQDATFYEFKYSNTIKGQTRAVYRGIQA